MRVELTRLGFMKGAGDVLTAGIALAAGYSLVTRDPDFETISEATGLVIGGY